MITEIQDCIDDTLSEIGSDLKFTVRGVEYSTKSTLVDPSSFRQRGNLPDWMSKVELTVYISYKAFISLGLLVSDVKDIEKVYYQGAFYTTIKAIPFGLLENQAAYIFIGLAK